MDRAPNLRSSFHWCENHARGDNSWIDHPLITDLLGLFESLDQAHRGPRIFVDDLLLNHRHMHDRKDARLLKVFTLDLFVVGKQSSDPLIAADDGFRYRD